MIVRAERSICEEGAPARAFLALVAGTFVLGWIAGAAAVLKVMHLVRAPRWVMVSGTGYVVFMLAPIASGLAVTWLSGRLIRRGWGPLSLSLLGVGFGGLLAGLLAL